MGAPSQLHFAEFTLDLSRCVVLRGDRELALRRQAFDVLRYLAERAGQLVTKEELFEAIWAGAATSDDTLVQCVKDIRRALDDTDRRIIRAVPRRGYILEAAGPTTGPSKIVPAADPVSLAASSPASFVSGLARRAASNWPRSSLLVGAALIAAMSAWMGVWAFSGRLSPPGQRDQAYVLFRQADRLFSDRRGAMDNAGARTLFQQALALDGDHVPSLIGYAATELDDVLNAWSPRAQHLDQLARAERALARAVALDPNNAYGHRFQGRLWRLQGRAPEAVRAFEHALTLNPYIAPAHAELGRVKIEVGRAAEAVGHVETAIRLSPHDRWIYGWCFWAALGALHVGDDPAAVEWFEKGRQANPSFTLPLPWLAAAYALLGREDEARALIETYLRENHDYTMSAWKERHASRNPIVANQRERIAGALRRLGVPEGKVQTGSAR